MLIARRAQMQALVEVRTTAFKRQVAELLARHSPEQSANLQLDYLDSLVAFCART